ncbi:MAG TPA: FecR domain-containing protein [Chitinophagaceae bacterium]|nr:FecR domain-containing protein [Chitinophagaceae bacterium]
MAENIHDINDDLLVKHLTGETSGEETVQVEEWLQAAEGNRNYYDGLIRIWEESLKLAAGVDADENEAWQKLRTRFTAGEPQRLHTPARSTPLLKNLRRVIAAVFFLAVAGVVIYFIAMRYNSNPPRQLAVNATQAVVVDTLSDGSVVTLNKHSGISFPAMFKGKTREIKLTGEAFFKISPDKTKPFIIHVNDVTIQVVGTSFNVRSVNNKTEVIVETGIVKVSNRKQTVELLPKEKVIADSLEISRKDTAADKLYNYYRSREFVCNNTPLKRLVEILNEAYENHISIENKAIENLPITTVFKEESLSQIIAVITETFGITATEHNGNYVLR